MMISRQPSLFVIALVVGVLIAGCGSSKSSNTGGSSPAPASSAPGGTAQKSSPSASGPTGATGTTGVQQAVAVCRGLIKLSSNLTPSAKAKLEETCDKAEKGGLPEARAEVTEVCDQVINSLPLTAAAKEAAFAGCKAKVK